MNKDNIATSYSINIAACREANDMLTKENEMLRTEVEKLKMGTPTRAKIEAAEIADRLREIAVTLLASTSENWVALKAADMLTYAECLISERAATIERCAQVAESFSGPLHHLPKEIAAAIRALKDKS